MTTTIRAHYLTGRLANGSELGGGSLWHAVPSESWTALCGAKPGRRSAGWGPFGYEDPRQAVTCPRCLKKMAKAQAAADEARNRLIELADTCRAMAVEMQGETLEMRRLRLAGAGANGA